MPYSNPTYPSAQAVVCPESPSAVSGETGASAAVRGWASCSSCVREKSAELKDSEILDQCCVVDH